MSRPRIAFVLQNALGWRTYCARLRDVLDSRDDIQSCVIPVEHSRLETLFLKRNNMHARDHLYRRMDPIDAFAGRAGRTIRTAIEGFRPEVVHFAAHWPAAAIAEQPGAPPFTVTLDNTRAGIERDLPRGAWSCKDFTREANLLQAAEHVFPMSDWAKQSVISDCGTPKGSVTVMPPSVNVKSFVPARHDAPGPMKIIFIGNDIARKGATALANWVSGPLAGRAELHVVSSDPAAKTLSDRAIVHGRVPNAKLVQELLPSMNVLCLPTQSDMSPQVLVEAAAAGLPAVASAIGGIPGLVRDGKTGFAVPAKDSSGFIDALTQLANDRALCVQMGQDARSHALQHFDAGKNFNQMIDRLAVLASQARSIPV